MSGESFNPTEHAGDDFQPIPAGEYDLFVKAAAIKHSHDPAKAPYLNLQFQVLGGPYNNRIVFEIMNINHAKSDVRAIAKKQLGNLCVALKTGQFDIANVCAVLQDKVVRAQVTQVKDDYKGGMKNKVQKYLAAGDAPKPPTTQAPGHMQGVPF